MFRWNSPGLVMSPLWEKPFKFHYVQMKRSKWKGGKRLWNSCLNSTMFRWNKWEKFLSLQSRLSGLNSTMFRWNCCCPIVLLASANCLNSTMFRWNPHNKPIRKPRRYILFKFHYVQMKLLLPDISKPPAFLSLNSTMFRWNKKWKTLNYLIL